MTVLPFFQFQRHAIQALFLFGLMLALAACTPEPVSPIGVTSTPFSPNAIRIENVQETREFLRTNQVPRDNCGGDGLLTTTISREETTTQVVELTLTSSVEGGLTDIITARLEGEFNVQHGRTVTDIVQNGFEIPGRRQVIYEIEWTEIWQTGEVVIGDIRIPFRVRTGVDSAVRSLNSQNCQQSLATAEVTSAVVLTSTPEPTNTPTLAPTQTPQ
ncbi:MAG: hypothetical protein SF029_13635, partial [bacterium]|nr:hypothetical protein [bacterium]